MVDESKINKDKYNKKNYVDITRWNSYYYQFMLPLKYKPETIMEIGKGNGITSNMIKKFSSTQTFSIDINPELNPDTVCDVRDIPWEDKQVDMSLCYEVLEHIPFSDFEKAVNEIKRITKKHIIISLPYSGASFSIYGKLPFLKGRILRVPALIKRPKKMVEFLGVQHYWTLGELGTSIRKIKKKLNKCGLKVLEQKVPQVNPHHIFFVCEVNE